MRVHRRRLRAVLLGLAALAPAMAAAEGEAVTVRGIEWEGVSAISRKELAGHIFSQAPSWKPWKPKPEFFEGVLERDERRIAALYRRHGYYHAKVRHELDWGRRRRRVRITFHVDEGEPVRVAAFEVDLAPPLDEEVGRERMLVDLPLGVGDIFALRRYGAAKQEILARLANAGFPRAAIQGGAEVDAASREASVRWSVAPGPRVHFGAVEVSGLNAVAEPLVRREVTLEPGERFSLDALRETREGIYGLGLFRAVVVQPRPEEGEAGPDGQLPAEQTWPVDVQLTERPLRSIRVGLGWGTEDRFRGRLSWLHRNFLGGARRLELALRHSSLLSAFDAGLDQPRFLDPLLSLGTDLSLRREREPAYDADRLLTRVELARPLNPRWRARLAHQFEWNDVEDAADETGAVLEDPEGAFVLSFFELGLRRSTLDVPLDPKRGTWLDFSVEPSSPAIGSSASYLRLLAEGRGFLPLGPGVLASRLRIGVIDPFAETSPDEVPIVKRFFSGGSTTVRGFEYQRLGPLDVDDAPLGGTSLLEASLEWRFPVWRELGGVVFVDAGQVALEPWTWRLHDVFYSAGVGLRYRTPVGPLRLDFGQLLNAPDQVKRSRIHVSVGHSF